MITDPGRVPLGLRAWVGDGRRGASVAADGTIDWYASQGLTGPPDLWRLLDEAGAAVRVGPVREGSGARRRLPVSRQRHLAGSNVVETVMEGPPGRWTTVWDFMPWPGPGLDAPGGIIRLVRALSGPVEVEVEVITGASRRSEAAASSTGLVLGPLEITAAAPFEPAPLERGVERWRALITLDAGEETVVTVGPRGVRLPVTAAGAHRALEDTETAWRSWLAGLVPAAPYRPTVERALLSVRALTGPGGAPHGSGTTSLPRRVGSERTSDDRWVRLRDVARAAQVYAAAGLVEDAEAAERWMRDTLSTSHLPWPGWFDADGQPVPEADEWPFGGWRDSGPVRHGRLPNPADIGLLGDVVAAVGAVRSGPLGRPDDAGPLSAAWPALAGAADRAVDDWRQPDLGRWEIERPRRMYTAGRLALWSGLDRMVQLARAANPLDLQAVVWQQETREILRWLENSAVAGDGGLRMDGGTDSDEPDAALLAVTWSGPWPRTHPVVAATVDRVLERLSSEGLLYRYSDRVADKRSGPDSPDLEASLLAVKALSRLGRWEEAHDRMEAVVNLIGDGAAHFSETADPISGELLGNFPSTAPALALVDAAAALGMGPR